MSLWRRRKREQPQEPETIAILWADIRDETGRTVGSIRMAQVGAFVEPLEHGWSIPPNGSLQFRDDLLGVDWTESHWACPECGNGHATVSGVRAQMFCWCTGEATELQPIRAWVDA